MPYVTSRTGGTVVIGPHAIHANRATPFEKVPAEVRRLDGDLVTVSKEDPFAMKAEGIVQSVTKNGALAGEPGPSGGDEPPAGDPDESTRPEGGSEPDSTDPFADAAPAGSAPAGEGEGPAQDEAPKPAKAGKPGKSGE